MSISYISQRCWWLQIFPALFHPCSSEVAPFFLPIPASWLMCLEVHVAGRTILLNSLLSLLFPVLGLIWLIMLYQSTERNCKTSNRLLEEGEGREKSSSSTSFVDSSAELKPIRGETGAVVPCGFLSVLWCFSFNLFIISSHWRTVAISWLKNVLKYHIRE